MNLTIWISTSVLSVKFTCTLKHHRIDFCINLPLTPALFFYHNAAQEDLWDISHADSVCEHKYVVNLSPEFSYIANERILPCLGAQYYSWEKEIFIILTWIYFWSQRAAKYISLIYCSWKGSRCIKRVCLEQMYLHSWSLGGRGWI